MCSFQLANLRDRIAIYELADIASIPKLDKLLGRAFELGQRLLFKHCIVIVYAVSCCLLPMQTPYYL